MYSSWFCCCCEITATWQETGGGTTAVVAGREPSSIQDATLLVSPRNAVSLAGSGGRAERGGAKKEIPATRQGILAALSTLLASLELLKPTARACPQADDGAVGDSGQEAGPPVNVVPGDPEVGHITARQLRSPHLVAGVEPPGEL